MGRLWLGCVTIASWKSAALAERRKMVQQEVRSSEEADKRPQYQRRSRAVD